MSLAARIFRRIKLFKVFKEFFHRNASNAKPLSENDGRFYPPFIAKHEQEPTRDKFEIVHGNGSGEGTMAKIRIRKGELVCRFDGIMLTHQTLYTLQKQPGLYIEDPYFTGKVLHSCDPNTVVDMQSQRFWARKDIYPGDFITLDYESTEDVLFRSFDCSCGSDQCRGRISGKQEARELRNS